MSLEYIYFAMVALSLAASCICLLVIIPLAPTMEHKYVSSMIHLVTLFLIGYLIYYCGNDTRMMISGVKIEYLAGYILCQLIFRIVEQVYDIKIPIPLWIAGGIWITFLIVITMCFSQNSTHEICHWFYKSYTMETFESGRTIVNKVNGWGFWAFMATYGSYLVAMTIVFLRKIITTEKGNRRDCLRFYLIIVIPLSSLYIMLFTDPSQQQFPYVAVICGIASILGTILLRQQKFNNLYDLAYDKIVNSLSDPVFIIDKYYHVVRMNQSAHQLYPEVKDSERRMNYSHAPEELIQLIHPSPRNKNSVALSPYAQIKDKSYTPEVINIERNNHLFGYVLRLDDITEERTKYLQLVELHDITQKSLEQNVKTIMVMREKIVSGAIQYMLERDKLTGEHMRRISNYTFILAKAIERKNIFPELTAEYSEVLCQVAPLHDIGKIYIPVRILSKTEELNDTEKSITVQHPVNGAKFIDRFLINNPDDLFYRLAKEVALCHHENWDGSGYPRNLKEKDIPLSARIVSVVDTFDVLTSTRPNQKTYSFDEAFEEVCSRKEISFDPQIIEVFAECKSAIQELYMQTVR